MNLKDGSLLQGGKYKIERVLGQGGFGITYLAMQVKLERNVAIKEFFPKDYCNRDETTSHVSVATKSNIDFMARLQQRFLSEAINISKLSHPGIVKIHDIFEENDTAYYVMDYVEGSSLSDIVKRNGPLPQARAIGYIKAVGHALAYMHANQMTHYDIKPDNIMVSADTDMPMLIDFGLSKQYSDGGSANSTTLNAISHGYSPSEQYIPEEMEKFSPQTDVYALGATLLYLITGKTPPHASIVNEDGIDIPSGTWPSVEKAIRGAMKPRRRRFQSVEEFLRVLSGMANPDENGVIAVDLEEEPESTVAQRISTGSTSAGKKITATPPSPPPPPKRRENIPTSSDDENRTSSKTWDTFGLIIIAVVAFGVGWVILFALFDGGSHNGSYSNDYDPIEVDSSATMDDIGTEVADTTTAVAVEAVEAPEAAPASRHSYAVDSVYSSYDYDYSARVDTATW